jgi:MFS family permease
VVCGRRHRPGDYLNGVIALLRRRHGFRALWAALVLSLTGSGAALVALTLYVQETQGTGTAVAALLIAEGGPRILGPIFDSLAERFELRRLMIGVDLTHAAVFGLIALLPPFGILLGLAAVSGGTLLTGLAPAIAVVMAAQLVYGVGNGMDIVATETILHQQVPRRMLGRIAGLLSTAAAGGAMVTAAAAPVLLRSSRG